MTEYEERVADLMYSSECCKYAASKANTPETKAKFMLRAQEFVEEANNVPKDYKKPEFKMPEWGTYGT